MPYYDNKSLGPLNKIENENGNVSKDNNPTIDQTTAEGHQWVYNVYINVNHISYTCSRDMVYNH